MSVNKDCKACHGTGRIYEGGMFSNSFKCDVCFPKKKPERKYVIIRFYAPETGKPSEKIHWMLTLKEARNHVENPKNQSKEWFDAYTDEANLPGKKW